MTNEKCPCCETKGKRAESWNPGFPWIPMDSRIPMDSNGFQWLPMDSRIPGFRSLPLE